MELKILIIQIKDNKDNIIMNKMIYLMILLHQKIYFDNFFLIKISLKIIKEDNKEIILKRLKDLTYFNYYLY